MMSNLAKLDFKALNINGDNYLSWQLDAKIHLQSKKSGETIKEGNKISPEEKVLCEAPPLVGPQFELNNY